VYDKVDIFFEGCFQDVLVVGKKILSPTPDLDAWVKAKVKSKVCISEQQDRDLRGYHGSMVLIKRLEVTPGL